MKKITKIVLIAGSALAATATVGALAIGTSGFKSGFAWGNFGKTYDNIVTANINWDRIAVDKNYVLVSKNDTTKTAAIRYSSDDDTEYVKAPKNIAISGVNYAVTSVALNGGYQGWGAPETDFNIKALYLPDSVTSIGNSAFYGCTALASVQIPDSVTSIESNAFSGCTALASVQIPDSVTSIESNAFYGCTALGKVEIPDSVTSIGNYVFRGCTALGKVEIPDSVTSIGDSDFYGCTALASVQIPDSVTSIGDSAFSGCTALAKVEIPVSVTSIKDHCFYGLDGGAYFLDHRAKPTVGKYVISANVPVYFDAYKADVTWATLATERPAKDQKVYYKGMWEMKDGKPSVITNAVPAVAASLAATSSAAA